MSNDKQVKVAKVINMYTVVLNIGSDDGAQFGDDFIVYRLGEDIIDPDTKESLGAYEQIIGRGTVTHIQKRICTLESSEIKDSGKKVIRKYNPEARNALSFLAIANPLMATSEEIIEEPEKSIRPFRDAQIGDYAKKS